MDVDGPVFQGEDLTWTQVEHEAYGDTVEHQRPRRSTQQTHQSQGARRRGKRPIIEEPEDEDDDDDEEDEIIPATQFQVKKELDHLMKQEMQIMKFRKKTQIQMITTVDTAAMMVVTPLMVMVHH
ncbi:hypothetical protein QJS10_CPA16g00246 [Acorus calamus]|uniref:Uncharacterized protein n=1 Tax=Acorus calamus TaxID=4465 RepID=A0AAV9D111_ACOCL|nr:hypothetical protein QJS10_CPA16g00246 [Acorus calamus]